LVSCPLDKIVSIANYMPAKANDVVEVALRLHRLVRQEESAHGLTGARRAVLYRLAAGGPQSVGALAAAELVSPPTMSRIVDGLVEARLAVRRPSPIDGRRVEVVPTALGKTLLEAVDRRQLRWLDAAMDDLPSADRAAVARAIEVLLALISDR
jgi:DNA-binding MarR family transcriptional regulator